MAFMNQDKKKTIAAALKVAMKEFPSVKYTLSVSNNSKITCTIKQGPKALVQHNESSISHHWAQHHIDEKFGTELSKMLKTIHNCLNIGNHDKSDVQTDYFDIGHYICIDIGSYKTPYIGV